jgi:hypothetical protein
MARDATAGSRNRLMHDDGLSRTQRQQLLAFLDSL